MADDTVYDPSLAYKMDESDEVIYDWIDIILFWYFALIFSVTGAQLSHASAFICNLRIFGIHEVMTQFRKAPGYINPPLTYTLLRCAGASILSTTVQKERGGDEVVEGWTILSIGATNLILTIDPYLREAAGCSKEIGPPTLDFPYGSWVDCEDWKLAYYATWYYSFAPFVLLAIIGGFLYCCSRICGIMDAICRFRNHIAIASISANAASLGTRVIVRRLNTDEHTDEINYFLDYCFYLYTGIIFLFLELVRRFCEDNTCFKWCCRGTCAVVALPLIMLDAVLKKMMEKAL